MTELSKRERLGRSQALARKPPQVRNSKEQRPGESGYDAFISYSHALDGRLAASLQSELERFAKPWYRSRARRIFRDTTNLSAAPHLWDAIQTALAASTWYVLLASPDAARSKWVDKEAKWWLEHRTVDRLLVVLTGGELAWQPEARRVDAARTTALPPSLVASITDEPLWVDLRWVRHVDQADPAHPAFHDSVADIVAAVSDMPKDALVGEDVKRQRQLKRWVRGVITSLTVLLVTVAAAGVVAVVQRNSARHQRQVAVSRQLAAVSDSLLANGQPDTAVLVGLESLRVAPNRREVPPSAGLVGGLADINHVSTSIRPGESLKAIAFSPDGKLLVSGGDPAVRLWDVATGRPHGAPLMGHTNQVNGVAFSPDGKLLASGGADNTVRLWDVATGRPHGASLMGHTNQVNGVAFSPDGKLLASASGDGTARLWDVATGGPRGATLPGHPDQANWAFGVAFSPDGKLLASASADNTVRLWNVATGRPHGAPLNADNTSLRAVAFSPDGKLLASAGNSGSVHMWDVATGLPDGRALQGHTGIVHAVAFSPDSKLVASASDDGSVRLWVVRATYSIARPLMGHYGWVTTVAFSPDGKLLASGGVDKTVRLWDVATGRPHGPPLTGHKNQVIGVAFSPDGKLLASGGTDSTIRLWDVATGHPHGAPLMGNFGWVSNVAFSPDGRLLASSSADSTIRLWDVATRRPHGAPLRGHAARVSWAAFSPDGKLLASGSTDKTVRLWDVVTGRPHGAPLTGHTNQVNGVAFSPDGKLLASGSNDASVRLWDVASGQSYGAPLAVHAVNEVAFSPDGKLLASAGFALAFGGTVELWNYRFDSWLSYGCKLVGRNLSVSEWRQYVQGVRYARICPERPSGETGSPNT